MHIMSGLWTYSGWVAFTPATTFAWSTTTKFMTMLNPSVTGTTRSDNQDINYADMSIPTDVFGSISSNVSLLLNGRPSVARRYGVTADNLID